MDDNATIPEPGSTRKPREWRRLEHAMRTLQMPVPSRSAARRAPPACVLVVDDDEATRLLYSINLELDGFTVLEACDGRRGLALARSQRPDIVLTDVMMPGLDGFELADALSRDPVTRRIPVIFVTGETTPGNEARAHAVGALAYLTKPLDVHALVTMMSRVRWNDQPSQEAGRRAPV